MVLQLLILLLVVHWRWLMLLLLVGHWRWLMLLLLVLMLLLLPLRRAGSWSWALDSPGTMQP